MAKPTEQSAQKKSGCRKWVRLSLIFALLLAIAVPLINGMLFRKIVAGQVHKLLANQYLQGEFEVGGTLLEGITIRDADLKGTRHLRHVQIDTLEIDYRIASLIRKQWGEGISTVTARGIRIEVAGGEKFPLDPEIETRKAKAKRRNPKTPESHQKLWSNLAALLEQNIEISDLDLLITQPGEGRNITVDDFDLKLASGSGTVSVADLHIPGVDHQRSFTAELDCTGGTLIAIQDLQLENQIDIDRIEAFPPPFGTNAPSLAGQASLFGGEFVANQTPDNSWKLDLESGSVDLASLAEWFGQEIDLDGKVTELAAEFPNSEEIKATVRVEQLRYEDYRSTSLRARANYAIGEQKLSVERFDLEAGEENHAGGSAEYLVGQRNLSATSQFEIEDLLAFGIPIGGSAHGSLDVGFEAESLTSGKAKITAKNLTYESATLESLELEVDCSAPDLLKVTLIAEVDEDDRLETTATLSLDDLAYDARSTLQLSDFDSLKPRLIAFLDPEKLPSPKLKVSGTCAGIIGENVHRGEFKIRVLELVHANGEQVAGSFDLSYAPEEFALEELQLKSGSLSITGAARLADKRVKVEQLHFREGTNLIASADAALPFDVETAKDLDSFLSQAGEIEINVISNRLQLSDLIKLAGADSDATATLDSEFRFTGSLAVPKGKGQVLVKQMRPSAETGAEDAIDAQLTFNLDQKRLDLDGEIIHAKLAPITLAGTMPLDFRRLGELSDQPIDLTASLPETPLALAKSYLPGLEKAEGQAHADLRVTGSPQAPKVEGEIYAKSAEIKFTHDDLPRLTELEILVKLRDNQIDIERFGGYAAGGRIDIGGMIGIESLASPELEVDLKAQQALITRDDDLSLRANANLKLLGPWQEATLSGRVGITQSRFFREIEILPIGLPRSSPTPAAPAAPKFNTADYQIGTSVAPFADWKIDVQIGADDPFLIRSNLASGKVVPDLRIGGTGSRLVPDGVIRLDEGIATLPFSDLKTTEGTLTFSEKTMFDPRLSVKGVSKVQQHEIKLFAYGPLSDPKTLITSDPPLPEEDAVALLATGATRDELSDGQVIAGDAALLLIDKIRRKVTKGTALERRPRNMRDLLSFKAGQIDPRTGKRAASASLEVTDNVFLLGNIDVEGEYRGLLKFVFRFK